MHSTEKTIHAGIPYKTTVTPDRQSSDTTLPRSQFLRLPEVIKRTGLSRSGIYAEIHNKRFPAPYRLTKRSVGWLLSEIETWIGKRIADRDNEVSLRTRATSNPGGTDA